MTSPTPATRTHAYALELRKLRASVVRLRKKVNVAEFKALTHQIEVERLEAKVAALEANNENLEQRLKDEVAEWKELSLYWRAYAPPWVQDHPDFRKNT